jgi:hypothetical protein
MFIKESVESGLHEIRTASKEKASITLHHGETVN